MLKIFRAIFDYIATPWACYLIVTPREMLAGTWAPVPWPSWMGVGYTWGILWLGHFVMSTTNDNKGTCGEKVVIMILHKYNCSFLVHIRSKLTWAMPSSFLFEATTAMPYYFNIFDEHRITFTWESPSPLPCPGCTSTNCIQCTCSNKCTYIHTCTS